MDIRQFRQHALDESVKTFGATGGAIYLGADTNRRAPEVSVNWQDEPALNVPLANGVANFGQLSLGARQNGSDYTKLDCSVLQQTIDLIVRAQSLAPNESGKPI